MTTRQSAQKARETAARQKWHAERYEREQRRSEAFVCPACDSRNVSVRDHAGHGQSDNFRPDPGMTSRCEDCGHEWGTRPVTHAIKDVFTLCGLSLVGPDAPDAVYVGRLVTCEECVRADHLFVGEENGVQWRTCRVCGGEPNGVHLRAVRDA